MNLSEISKPIEKYLSEFEKYFKNSMKSNVSLLDIIIRYIARKKGKQIRPVLVFLTAEMFQSVTQRTFIAAAMVELLHTATLIHDDVVDEASERRGIASINAAWSNKIAVLIGDYLLAKGLLISIDNDEFTFLKALSTTVRKMSEGELLQIQKSKQNRMDEETYLRIISDKTASLLSTCCEVGALSSGTSTENVKKMAQFGNLIGLAFQIKDDIFDVVSVKSKIGKPTGNDLKEKKITLPLIYTLNQIPNNEAKTIIKTVKSGKINKKETEMIINLIKEHGGIEYSIEKAKLYIDEALDILKDMPDNEARKSLTEFAKFVLEREN